MKTKLRKSLKSDTQSFVYRWDSFPIDLWWRKRYNVPFGSHKHREMNFIDMYVEWLETLEINKANAVISNNDGWTKEDEERLGLKSVQSEPITQEEIDEDYENLDLSQFDKK